jgi:hypothetical protein
LQSKRKFAPGRSIYLFSERASYRCGIQNLGRYGVVSLIHDDFGPTIFRPEEHLSDWVVSNTNPIPLFRKYNQLANIDWLRRAIRSVNETYDSLSIEPTDFAQDNVEIQWEPIPLDRSNGVLAEATEEVQKAINLIEQHN